MSIGPEKYDTTKAMAPEEEAHARHILVEDEAQAKAAVERLKKGEDFAKVARQYNKTCLFVTHRIEDALEMSDRVIVLRPGAGIALEQSIDDAMRADESRLRELHQTIADRMGSGPAA